MEAIWFKEFRLYTSFDRALWCALIWPFILALNPLFLEAGESLSTAMTDAPCFSRSAWITPRTTTNGQGFSS